MSSGNFPQKQSDALAAIDKLNAAIERRRTAQAEVGKAQKELAAVRVKSAATDETLDAALKEFGEMAAHW